MHDCRAELATRTWIAAGEATGDDVLGIHVAERAPVGIYGALEYSIRSCATVGHALRQLARYYRIVSHLSSVAIDVEADVFHLRHVTTFPTPPAVADSIFATVVRGGRELTHTAFLAREVRLTRQAPAQRGEHERFFCAPVTFAAARDELVFDAELLDVPLLTADAELNATLGQRTEAQLDALPSADRFLRTVRLALIRALQSGAETTVTSLARALNLSERTLQRRLRENETSHSEVLDHVRHELALSYLSDDVSSIEAAYLLGFSEAAAFHRAFKRWTGTTPRDFRQRQNSRTP